MLTEQRNKVKKMLNDQLKFIYLMKENEKKKRAGSHSDEELSNKGADKSQAGKSVFGGESRFGGSVVSKASKAPQSSAPAPRHKDMDPMQDLENPKMNE